MDRILKFRAWDKKEKFMRKPANWISSYLFDLEMDVWDVNKGMSTDALVAKDRFIFLQFTGLKDKNGKEVYEGDIFEVTDGDGWIVGTHTAVLDGETLSTDSRIIGKILGNIIENPELLK